MNNSWKKISDLSIETTTSFASCIGDGSSAKKTYDCIYRGINEGVLP